jgi:hypothetical protein
MDPDCLDSDKKLIDSGPVLQFDFLGTEEEGDLIATYEVSSEDFGELKNSLIRITTKQIGVFDEDGKLRGLLKNTTLRDVYHIDQEYLYCLCSASKIEIEAYRRV